MNPSRKEAVRFWRSLDEYSDTAEFREWLHREFPPLASEWDDGFSRRNFLKLMGASFALAGLNACTRQPLEKIVPYVRQPAEMTPGNALHFASAMTLGGYAKGVIVESHEGRPTKIEGNPNHPASLGATDVFMQAAVLDLYDPDRSQTVLNAGAISTWSDFLSALHGVLQSKAQSGGAGLRILTQTVTSPTLHEQIQALLTTFPSAKWHQWEAVNRDNVREGARNVFGEIVDTIYRFDKAEVIVSLDANFLGEGPAQLRYIRDFASGRRVSSGSKKMNRLYVAETAPTITGTMADHRLPAPPSGVRVLAEAIARELGILSEQLEGVYDSAFVSTAAGDLNSHRGASIVIAGDEQPAHIHALAHRMNAALGNVGQTVFYTTPVEPNPVNQLQSLRKLVTEMSAGRVELLLVLGGNPVFDTPADLDFAKALDHVKWRTYFGTYANETAALCHWHVPEAHWLETWSDARAFDGTASIVQPLIMPLYEGKSAHELLAAMTGNPNPSGYEILRDYWLRHGLDDAAWRKSLRDGLIAGTASAPRQPGEISTQISTPIFAEKMSGEKIGSTLAISFRTDPAVYDGRFSNNGWLQELPRPLTKLTWDNAALLGPGTAQQLDLQTGDVVEITHGTRNTRMPVFVQPGHADGAVTLHFGYGRTHAGNVGNNVGSNVFPLRVSDDLWVTRGEIRKTGDKAKLVTTQQHHNVEGRDILRLATLQRFTADPKSAWGKSEEPAHDETLYNPDEYKNTGYAWGMSIDLTTCIGCGVCTIACQAENNIPVVGKYQVSVGREMQWIRVDTYHEGTLEQPQFHHQPVPCMHCEHAPCELVCPVGATVHDSEGLNVQVYNRCVGTRYCSNNCPYKVRRFNFLEYNKDLSASEKMVKNPDVTVRSRGVMEKCTYCLQRINRARIPAEVQNRAIRDGEIVPACAQACPAEAIVFGNIRDPNSRVSKLKASPLDYSMLGELNTRPRTTYLARLTNPNPEFHQT